MLIQGITSYSQVFTAGIPQSIDNTSTPLFKGLDLRRQASIATPSLGLRLGNIAGNISVKDSLGVTKTVPYLENPLNIFSGNFKSGNYSVFLQGDAIRNIYGGAFVLTRNLTNAGSNPHGFDENSTLNAAGTVAMNAFGVHSTVTGNNNYNHFNGFQCFPTISNTGTLTNLVDFAGKPNIVNATVSNRIGISVNAAELNSGATILNQYGVKVEGMANATNNWAFYSNSPTKSFFGGPTQINYSTPITQSNVLEVNGSIRATSFSNTTGVVLGGGFSTGFGGLSITGGTPYSNIQSIQEGVGYTNLILQRQGGNVGIGTPTPTSKLQVVGLPVYADNTAALAGGLTAGAFYRTSTGVLMVAF